MFDPEKPLPLFGGIDPERIDSGPAPVAGHLFLSHTQHIPHFFRGTLSHIIAFSRAAAFPPGKFPRAALCNSSNPGGHREEYLPLPAAGRNSRSTVLFDRTDRP